MSAVLCIGGWAAFAYIFAVRPVFQLREEDREAERLQALREDVHHVADQIHAHDSERDLGIEAYEAWLDSLPVADPRDALRGLRVDPWGEEERR